MAGKFRETVIHQVAPKKDEPKTSEEKNVEIAGADVAPALSQDAINALNEARAAKEAAAKAREIGGPKARNQPGLAIGKTRAAVSIFRRPTGLTRQ